MHTEPIGRMQDGQIRDAGPAGRCIAGTNLQPNVCRSLSNSAFSLFFVKVTEYALLIGYADTRTTCIQASHSSVCPRNFRGIFNPTARLIFPVLLQVISPSLIWAYKQMWNPLLYCSPPIYTKLYY